MALAFGLPFVIVLPTGPASWLLGLWMCLLAGLLSIWTRLSLGTKAKLLTAMEVLGSFEACQKRLVRR
jgi:hypothetical protein